MHMACTVYAAQMLRPTCPPPPIYSLQTCRGTERMACTAYAAQMRVGSNLSVMVLRAGQELTLTLR